MDVRHAGVLDSQLISVFLLFLLSRCGCVNELNGISWHGMIWLVLVWRRLLIGHGSGIDQ